MVVFHWHVRAQAHDSLHGVVLNPFDQGGWLRVDLFFVSFCFLGEKKKRKEEICSRDTLESNCV